MLWTAFAVAQQQLPELEPLPEPPPPPPGAGPAEPAVRIPVPEGDKVEVVRDGARVIMLKVTPAHGRPYYLVNAGGDWIRRDSLDEGLLVPMWPIYTFD